MPSSLEALGVVVLFVLPGALFHWTYERTVGGAWTVGLDDRILRFLRSSAVLHVVLLPLTWWLLRRLRVLDVSQAFDFWFWGAAIVFLVVPCLLGAGGALVHQHGWTRKVPLIGALEAPRAWDHAFGGSPAGWLRIRLQTGVWIAGILGVDEDGHSSFVSAFPRDRDIYLARRVDVNGETGEWNTDEGGAIRVLDSGMLVGWERIDVIEFFPREAQES